jgi:alpha-1,3-rhamnosyltransferase
MNELQKDSAQKETLPLVTIAVASFNHAKFIGECIRSVIDQDYPNIELIVIDDGSIDQSMSVIEGLRSECEERFVKFESWTRSNRGATETYNEALRHASGRYFAQLDSDDLIMPEKISELVRVFQEEPSLVAVVSGWSDIDECGNTLAENSYAPRYYNFEDMILHRQRFATAGQLMLTDAVRESGGYPENCWIGDWYMWLVLTKSGKLIKSIPNNLARYRHHGYNSLKNREKMFEGRKQVLSYFRESPHYGIAMAQVYVWVSRDFCFISKSKAVGYLLAAVRCTSSVMTHRFFYVATIGVFTPKWLAVRIPFFRSRFRLVV